MSTRFFFAVSLLSVTLAAPVLAKDASPPAKPEGKAAKHEESHSARTPVTAKGYGSWALRCEEGHSQGPGRICEISETIQTADNRPVAKISVGRRKPGDPLGIIVILPTNVSFPSSVHIRTDKEDKWGLELQWQRCIPGACMAQAEMNTATVEHWSGLKTDGDIVFRDAAGDEVELPMSMHGFGDAYSAFNK
jgi:invasion protein IalB